MLESHYSEMFCESSLITPINLSFIAPIWPCILKPLAKDYLWESYNSETSHERPPTQESSSFWTPRKFWKKQTLVSTKCSVSVSTMRPSWTALTCLTSPTGLWPVATRWGQASCPMPAPPPPYVSSSTSTNLATSCNAINPLGFSCSSQPHESSCKEIFCKRSQL